MMIIKLDPVDAVRIKRELTSPVMKMSALAFEYQRDYVAARGDLNVFDLVNNPSANGKCRVFGLSFGEKSFDDFLIELRSLGNDAADPFVIGKDVA